MVQSYEAFCAATLLLATLASAQEPEVYPVSPAAKKQTPAAPEPEPERLVLPTTTGAKPPQAAADAAKPPQGPPAEHPANGAPATAPATRERPWSPAATGVRTPDAARPQPGAGASAPRGPLPEARDGAEQDALDRLIAHLGGDAAFRALEGLKVTRVLRALDARGAELFDHVFEHEATFAPWPGSDTIQWSDDTSFGIAGGRAWERVSGVDRPDLEARARHEAAVWATLLRFPFGLRDRSRWLVMPERNVVLHARTFILVRVLQRDLDPAAVAGPERRDTSTRSDGVDLYLDPNSRLPVLLELRKPHGQRRIVLSEWREVFRGGPRLPHVRTVLEGEGDRPSLEIRWKSVRHR